MAKLMGFSGFDTTQNKHVNDPNANVSGVFKKTKREARQYMNRPGGFNKPLPSEKTR
jgi:U4/U6.U5 tri-snRNP-associated protein 3